MDSTAISKVKKLIEQSANFDADERTMALLDLCTEMQKHSNLDASLQVPCRNALISRLQDKNGTVKTAAVKWLTETAPKFDSEQIIYIADKLGGMVVEKKQEKPRKENEDESAESGSVRDFADGLSNLLTVLSDDNGKVVAPNLAKHLIKGLSYSPSKDTELEMVCLDLLQQLIRKFGGYINGDVESDGKKETNTDKLLKTLQTLLEHPDENVQERTSFTIGPLVLILSEKPFTQMIERVISQIEKSKNPDLYIKTIGAVSQTAGLRVAQYLPKFVPRLIKFCVADDEAMSTDDAEKMKRWEICLNTLASIIKSCPTSVSDYLKNIVQISLKLMTFDPNFQDDDDVAMDTGEQVDWGGDGGDGGDDGWGEEPAKPAKGGDKKAKGDDDWDTMAQKGESITADESWKVRRGAVRVLSVFIQYQSDKLKQYYGEICDQFVKRFKERDVNVKEDILLATCLLLKEGVVIEKQGDRAKGDDDLPTLSIPTLVRTRSTYETLDLKTDDIIKGLNKQLTTPNVETRTKKAIFKVLSELLIVKQGELGDHLQTLAPHITSGLEAEGKDDVMNPDAIKLLHLVLEFHNFDQIQPFVKLWTAGLTKLVKKGKRGNVADALHALGSLAKKAAGKKVSPELVQEWFKTTLAELEQKDTQEKVKMASISAMGTILANFGDAFSKEVPKVLSLFDERLRNETTRKPVLRALTKTAGSDSKVDLRPLLTATEKDKDKKPPLAEMTTFMRKTDADLKHLTANTIEAFVKRNAADFKKDQYDLILAEVATHIGDADLMMASHCLKLVSTTLAFAPGPTSATVGKEIVPKALKLVTSPLLQGQALVSLIAFFQQAVVTEGKVKELTYNYLQPALLALVVDALPKDNVQAVAKIIAGMTAKVSEDEANKTVGKFVGDIKGGKTAVHVKYVALLSLGEIGKLRDLSGQSGLEKVVFSAFSDPNVQQAASYALGSISIGNLKYYLPILTGLIKPSEERLYLLLSALNEIIKAQSESQTGISSFGPYIDTVTPILEDYLESKNEGVRSVVAESLGRLTVFDPEKFFPKIAALAEKKNNLQRLAAIVALRFSFNEHLRYAILGPYLKNFLVLLKDPDLEVRRQACVTVNSLLHAHADSLPREVLAAEVLPPLYSEVKAHPELIEEKDYVAVKITVDHGLPLRKEVYSCLLALLQLTPKRLVMQEYIKHVKEGLVDHTCDIQILAYEIFKHIALNESESLLEFLDTLPDLLLKKIKDHLKAAGDQKTGQKERDVLRAFVSSCVLFNKIQGVELCTKYTKFFKQVCATALLKEMLAELSKGTSSE